MNKNYIVKQMANTRWFLNFTESNEKGETLIIELSKCENCDGSNSLPNLWKKNGCIDRVLETYWSIQTYIKDTEGNNFMLYNPQVKNENGRSVLNFDWMFEATEKNKEKLINEVYRLFSSAKGETATEIKQRKIKEYAEQNNIQIYEELPQGWKVLNYAYAPTGSVIITNRLTLKSKNREKGLLLID